MIIVSATMYPQGDKERSYELLHATIENRTGVEDFLVGDRYMAHVLSRPNRFISVSGYEADVEVRAHNAADGVAPLIVAVLRTADNQSRVPETRQLARVTIEDAAAFEQRLRART